MKYLVFIMAAIFLGCQTVKPPKKVSNQYQLATNYAFTDDSLHVRLANPLHCPMRIWVQPKDTSLMAYFNRINPVTLPPLQDTTISVKASHNADKEVVFGSRYGDIAEKVDVSKVELPFQKNKAYSLVQAYNSTPTHNTDWSRYALDFGLAVGDTVCAATPGYVVGVVENYKHGGTNQAWKNFANRIVIYDPATGLYTQYVHLKYKGSLVEIGDRVTTGQNIGISGMTGWTTIAHLHFNCYQPVHSSAGLISIPMDSIGHYRIADLKRYEMILHKK